MSESIQQSETVLSPKDEVLRKIGRNLLTFQKIEGMLKYVVANGVLEGYGSKLTDAQKEKAKSATKMTMGQLVGNLMKGHYGDQPKESEIPAELVEGWFSFKFTFDTTANHYAERESAFADLVAARNELIHHFLPRWNPESEQSTLDAIAYLDSQHEKAVTECDILNGMVERLNHGRQILAEFVASEEFHKQFDLMWLQQSRLVVMLTDIVQQLGSEDGCVLLNAAGKILLHHAPEDYAAMLGQYGHKTLKSLIQASELFEIVEEPTSKGGTRVFYRLLPSHQAH